MSGSIISIAGGRLQENSSIQFMNFVVTLSAPSPDNVTVDYQTVSGTAQEGVDYRAASSSLTIAAGDTSGIISILITGDTLDETDENFTLELTNPTNATLAGNAPALRANGVILDDDGNGSNLALFVSNPILTEGDSGSKLAQFTVTLSQPSATAITVSYATADGSARAASDYTATNGTLTFAPGQTTATVDVFVLGDTTREATENFSLVVTPTAAIASGAADAVGVATILDDDAGGTAQPTLSVSGASLVENSGAQFMNFVVTLSAPSPNSVTVDYQTVSGTAQEGTDYRAASSSLTIAAGDTSGIISILITGDTLDETDENFTLELTNPTNATLAGNAPALRANGVILDDDGNGSNLALFVSNPILTEGDSGSKLAQFTVTLSQPSATAITVSYATADGSARAASDYTATNGTLTFAPGQTTATVDVPVLGDTTREATENFSLVVTPTAAIASGAADAVGVATILDDDAGGTAQPTLSVSGASLVENSGAQFMNFVVTLSASSPNSVTVDYQTVSGMAQEGVDYRAASGSLTIAAGDTSGIISILITGDTLDETDENFTLELTNPTNATLAGNAPALRANGVILDDDGNGSNLALFVSNPILTEGDSGSKLAQFTVTLSQPSATAITVSYATADGSARAASDYTATNGTLTFAPGQTTATVDVFVLGDTTREATENFSLVVTPTAAIASGAADAVGVATILDDDAGGTAQPTLSVSGASLVENSGAQFMNFVVTLSAPSPNSVTVDYQTVSGTAQEGVDYRAASGSLTIAAGDTSGIISILITGDTLDETDENFTLELTNPTNATLAGNAPALRANGVILDDDGNGSNLALFVSNPILTEGDSGSKLAQFTVTLSQPSATAITVSYATADGSARAASDYTATNGTLTFAPGQTTATVDVPVLGDTAREATENFSLVVTPTAAIASGAADAVGVATILDDDAAPITLSVSGASLVENSGAQFMNFVVTLSASSPNSVTVDYQTVSGMAQEGVDYRAASGSLTIAAGDTSGIISILITGDTLDETDENFTLELTNPTNATLAGNAPALRANGVILDDDGNGSNLALFVSNPILTEGDSGSKLAQFTVTLSQPSATAITVSYATADGSARAASDYTATNGTLTFAPGQTTATVDVPVLGDTAREATENFSLVVTPTAAIASGAADAVGVATILDDDAAPVTLSVSSASLVENSGAQFMNFVVTLSAPSPDNVTVHYQTKSGTAQEGVDYRAASGNLTIAAGDTSGIISILITGDTLDETDENFTLELTAPVNAKLAGNALALRANGVILDDDGNGSNLALFVSNPNLTEGDSGSKLVQFEVTLSRPSNSAITASYGTADGSAVAGSDYTATSGTVSFAPGQTTTTIDVPILAIPGADKNFSLAVTPAAAVAAAATGTATIEPVCYRAGTHILTDRGEVAVEDLAVGNGVVTASGVVRPVRWLGHRRIDLTTHPRPETVAPIRIERDAFADNVPHRDLLVSPDHAVFVDGVLICARQLVNGATIRREKGWSSADYYHVELNEHAILLAEGLPAESYLDTGNRGFFANAGAPLVLHPDLTDETEHPTREAHSCAPFVWDEASVQPVWQRLADRAGSSRQVTTTDADMRLLADQRTIKPVFSNDDRVMFMLPRGVSEVRLFSRAQSPAEARPWLNDQRRLGVRVKRMVVRDGDETREIPMDHPDITRGWWDVEQDGPIMSRWTDGDAVLPLPPMRGIAMLEVHLAGAMTYAVDVVPEDVESGCQIGGQT